MDDNLRYSTNSPIHVWLIDDDNVYRQYVREALLPLIGSISLSEFTHCEDAINRLSSPPEVILLDISLPGGMSGLEGLEVFHKKTPQTHVIIVTISEDDEDIYLAFCRGACGYVVKSSLPGKTVEAIYDAVEGRSFIDSHIAGKILRMHDLSTDLRKQYQLTPTEIKILDLIKGGRSRKAVLNELYIAETTLKYHLQNIYSKLQVHSLTEAITKTSPKGI